MDFVRAQLAALFAASDTDTDMYLGAAVALVLFVVFAVPLGLLKRRHDRIERARRAERAELARQREEQGHLLAVARQQLLDLVENKPEELKTRLAAEAEAYFTRFGSISGKSEMNITDIGGMRVMDFTSDKEKLIEQEARSGISVGPCFDVLVAELREIGRRFEFTIVSENPLWGSGDYEGRAHKRARAIGCILDAGGGMELMQAAWCRIKATQAGAKGDAKDLSRCWDRVGKWQY